MSSKKKRAQEKTAEEGGGNGGNGGGGVGGGGIAVFNPMDSTPALGPDGFPISAPGEPPTETLDGFVLTRVLQNDIRSKRLVVLGYFKPVKITHYVQSAGLRLGTGEKNRVIITFEQPAFATGGWNGEDDTTTTATTDTKSSGNEQQPPQQQTLAEVLMAQERQSFKQLLSASTLGMRQFHNDKYYGYPQTQSMHATMKMDIICPASDDDIKKKSSSRKHHSTPHSLRFRHACSVVSSLY